jgi:glutamate-1-semialdehyde 2,1-aminomutase
MADAALANADLEAVYVEAEERFRAANPKSAAINQSAIEVMPGGNTRTVIHYAPYPLTFAKGEGARLWDADGHELVDFLGEYTAGLFGHSDPIIQAAVETALHDGVVLGGPNMMEARLARVLVDRFPALDMIRFTNSGTEANMMSIGAARGFTGRQRIIACNGGYHGGVLYFAAPSPINAPFPVTLVDYNDIEGTVAAIEEAGDELACMILEPMMGSSGCIAATPEYLRAIRAATEKVGALMILDEVMTSRLGPGGLHGKYDLKPDLITLGKYIGGGLTCGAFGGKSEIMQRFDPRRDDAWPHAGTFNNNVLTMAAGLAGMTQLYTPEAAETLNERGIAFRARLNDAIVRRGLPARAIGLGSMSTVHFTTDDVVRPGPKDPVTNRLRDLMHLDMIDRGVYIARRGMMNASLPMLDGDFDIALEAFESFLDDRAPVIRRAMADRSGG